MSEQTLALEVVNLQTELVAAKVGRSCSVRNYTDPTGRTRCKSVNNPADSDQGIVSLINSGNVNDFPNRLEALSDSISTEIDGTQDQQTIAYLENLKTSVETAIDSFPVDDQT